MGDFQNGLTFRILAVFSSRFLHRTTLMGCKTDFCLFSGILIFDRKWPFCKGYSLCMMADFKSSLISRIIGVFFGRLFAQNYSNGLQNWFLHVFGNFNVWAKLTILHDCRFSKWSHFWNIWCFFRAVVCTELLCGCRIDFCMFLRILIFKPNWQFCKGYIAHAKYPKNKVAKNVSTNPFKLFYAKDGCKKTAKKWDHFENCKKMATIQRL